MVNEKQIDKLFRSFIYEVVEPIFKEHPELSKEYFYDDGTFKPPIYNLKDTSSNYSIITIDPVFVKFYPEICKTIQPKIKEYQDIISSFH